MSNESTRSSKRVLEPNERIAEVLFGLIMVLTFTGSLSVAQANQAEVRTMLIGALGCNLAWGIIDGIFYLMGCLSEQGHGIRALRDLRKAATPEEAHRVIADALPPIVAASLGSAEYESMRQKLVQLPGPPSRPRLEQGRVAGGVGGILLGVPHHVPRSNSVHLHAQRRAGPARLQRHRHRAVIPDWLCVRARRRIPPMADRPRDDRARERTGGNHDSFGRII